MHLKHLLIAQVLAITCTQAWAYGDKHKRDEFMQPGTTTVAPEPLAEENATTLPAEGVQQLNDVAATINKADALPETTKPSVETTFPTTTIAESTTTDAEKEDLSPFPTYPPLNYPQLHPPLVAYPQPHSIYGYGFPYPPGNLGPEAKSASGKPTETPSGAAVYPGYPGYPYPNFPLLRPRYSPYGPPYPQLERFPNFPAAVAGFGYGKTNSADKGKPDATDDSVMGKEPKAKSEVEAPKPSAEPPSLGYPPVYVIRRPVLPAYPYGRNIGGYGSPYAYGR